MAPSPLIPIIILRVGDRIPLPTNGKIPVVYGVITKIDGDKVTVKTSKSTFYLDKKILQRWVTRFLHIRGLIPEFLESRVVFKSVPKYSDQYHPMGTAIMDAKKISFLKRRSDTTKSNNIKRIARFIANDLTEKFRLHHEKEKEDENDKLIFTDAMVESLPDRLQFRDKLQSEFRLSKKESDLLSKKVFWDKFTNYDGANDDRDKSKHALFMSDPESQRKLLRKKKSTKPKPKRKCRCKK
jgi:hypothetical protein